MGIVGIGNISPAELSVELKAGGRFVAFQYCISIVFMTFKRPSSIYFIRHDENPIAKGLPFSLCSLVLGWWGIPWGPIWTIGTIFRNFRGGVDVTAAVVQDLNAQILGAVRTAS